MSNEQMQNEINYILSVKYIQSMLDNQLITSEEFRQIDYKNRVSFQPRLMALMP